MRAVLGGLSRSFSSRAHETIIVSRTIPGNGRLGFSEPADGSVCRIGSFWALFDLLRLARRHSIGVIHLHFSGWLRPWMLWLPVLTMLRPIRLVVTFQDYEHPELPRNAFWRVLALRFLLRRSFAVTVVSDFLKARIAGVFPGLGKKVVTVNNGVAGSPKPVRIRPPSTRPYVLSVGRIAPYKGTDLLVLAFAGLARRDLDLVLCGAPFHGEHIDTLVEVLGLKGRVHLTGLKSPGEVRALMEGCLFYAAAPRAETFGMAVVEAMAAGKAVIAARTGGIPEYLRDGTDGLLVDPKDVNGLCRGMGRLLGDGALRRRLGASARRTARRFAWDRIAEEYLAVYRGAPFGNSRAPAAGRGVSATESPRLYVPADLKS